MIEVSFGSSEEGKRTGVGVLSEEYISAEPRFSNRYRPLMYACPQIVVIILLVNIESKMSLSRPTCRWKGDFKRNLKEMGFDETGFIRLSVGSKGMCLQTR